MAVLEKVVDMKISDRLLQVKFRKQEYSTNVLCEKSFSFYTGKIYGILCNHNECGWGVSYLLSGRAAIDQEKIFINGKEYNKGEIIKEGWYVGEGINKKFFCPLNNTLKKQILFALKQSKINQNLNDVIDKFELSRDKIDCKFFKLGWESWRASVAIGYAYGKKIYCYPWMDTAYLKELIYNSGFIFYSNILKNAGNITILPASDRCLLEMICDEIITINDSRFHQYTFIEEYIKQQKNL